MRKLSMDQLNRLAVSDFKEAPKLPLIIVLDNVRSLHNVGSVFRTADGFAIEKIYLCGITGQPPQREIEKTALGATKSIDWEYRENVEDAIQSLKAEGYLVAAVEQAEGSVYLDQFQPVDVPYALVFGHEVHGVSDSVMQQADVCLEIPQFGVKHSLNISVVVGIVLWDLHSKWTKKEG